MAALAGNAALTALAAASWLIYVCAYTPLKTRSAWGLTPAGY